MTTTPTETRRTKKPTTEELYSRAGYSDGLTQDDRDLFVLCDTVDTLYPDCRQYFKRIRAEHMGERGKDLRKPLHRAFDTLLDFAQRMQEDPALFARLRDEALPRWKAKVAQDAEQEAQQEDAPAVFAAMTTEQVNAAYDALTGAVEDHTAAAGGGDASERNAAQTALLVNLCDAAQKELAARQ